MFRYWQRAEEAPDGWRMLEDSRDLYSLPYSENTTMWIDGDGEQLLVPTQYAECGWCHGTGNEWGEEEDEEDEEEDDLDDDDWECAECRGAGVDYEDAQYDFFGAVSKTSYIRLAQLGVTDVSQVQWWKGQ